MSRWLIVTAAGPLLAATAAHAVSRESPRDRAGEMAGARSANLRLTSVIEPPRQLLFDGGTLVRRDLGSNAGVGIGLVNMSAGRTRANSRSDTGLRKSRRPAITFSWKF